MVNIGTIIIWYSELVLAGSVAVKVLSEIAKVTKTTKDDEIMMKITKFMGKFVALNTEISKVTEKSK